MSLKEVVYIAILTIGIGNIAISFVMNIGYNFGSMPKDAGDMYTLGAICLALAYIINNKES